MALVHPRMTVRWRRYWRIVCFVAVCLMAAAEWIFFVACANRGGNIHMRTAWLQRICARLVGVLGIRTDYHGPAASAGVLVSNHLSYLDILVLGARQPLVFVAKKEVRRWPGIGLLTSWAGTLFIDRQRRGDVARVGNEMRKVISQGAIVCVFLEGTSSNGGDVLPFRSALLEPVMHSRIQVTPAWLGYDIDDGSVAEEICYWRDMEFLPHFFELLGKREIRACANFGPAVPPGSNRKELAFHLREQVRELGRCFALKQERNKDTSCSRGRDPYEGTSALLADGGTNRALPCASSRLRSG